MEFRALKRGPFAGMQYGVIGEGPALVLVHGFAENHRIWFPMLIRGLSGFTYLLPVLPGTGESPLNTNSISLLDMAHAINDMLEQENKDTCIMLGHSMGGYITAAFAETYPDKIDGIGFIHSSVYADDDIKKENRLKGIAIIEKGGKAAFLQQLVPALYSATSQEKISDVISEHRAMAMMIPDKTLCAYYAAMRERPDRSAMLSDCKKPVLFVFGEHDQAVPLDVGLRQSTLPSLCDIHILKDVGHTAMNENPEKLWNILNKYSQLALAMKKS